MKKSRYNRSYKSNPNSDYKRGGECSKRSNKKGENMEREILLDKQEMQNKLPVEVEDISVREGEFVPENGGTPIHWKQYTIGFTIGNNPMVFRAKVDKVFNEYIPDALRGED